MKNRFDEDLSDFDVVISVLQWYNALDENGKNTAVSTVADSHYFESFLATAITLHMLDPDNFPEFTDRLLKDMGYRYMRFYYNQN